MHSYTSDYTEGALQPVLDALIRTNLEQSSGYGCDTHCDAARALISRAICRADADIHFVVGGTQANMLVIATALRPYQAAVCAVTGHINVHETGAIEASGHKVLPANAPDGKLTPDEIRRIVAAHTDEHMVQPKLVYISQSTELGTVYSLAELTALRACCDECGLYLYIDGARLGSALTSREADVTLPDIARLCDAFTIGGTKNGLLFGECIVLLNDALKPDFRYMIKQRGAMLAKGWLLGVQYETLFTDDLFLNAARHANAAADRIRAALAVKGWPLFAPSGTNQIFPIIPDDKLDALAKYAGYQIQLKLDDSHTVIRLVTSWATPDAAVDELVNAIAAL